jgi:hypothetical protein
MALPCITDTPTGPLHDIDNPAREGNGTGHISAFWFLALTGLIHSSAMYRGFHRRRVRECGSSSDVKPHTEHDEPRWAR